MIQTLGKPLGAMGTILSGLTVTFGTIRYFQVQELLLDDYYPVTRFTIIILILINLSILVVSFILNIDISLFVMLWCVYKYTMWMILQDGSLIPPKEEIKVPAGWINEPISGSIPQIKPYQINSCKRKTTTTTELSAISIVISKFTSLCNYHRFI